MVASHAVRPVNDSIHQPLKPNVVRDKVFILEQTRSPQSPNLRQHPLNHLLSCPNLLRQRPPEPFIGQKLLLVTREPFILTKPKNSDVCVWEKLLRIFAEEQNCRCARPAFTVDEISCPESVFSGCGTNSVGIFTNCLHIDIPHIDTGRYRRIELLLALGVTQFENAVCIQQPRFVADTQETVPRPQIMHTLTRVHMKQVNLRTVADIKRLDPNTHGWIRVIERCLSQIIVLFRRRHPIELPVSNSDSNNAALRISHTDDGFGEILRLDTERLSLEPLIFR